MCSATTGSHTATTGATHVPVVPEDGRRADKPPFSRPAVVPEGLVSQSLLERDGDDLEVHYRRLLTNWGGRPGMLGVVFRKARNGSRTRRSSETGGGSDRSRAMADPRCRRQGRRLRGSAGEERRGREVRRRPVLHAATAHQSNRGGSGSTARDADQRTLPAAQAVSCSRLRVDRSEPAARPRREAASSPPTR